MNRKYYSINEKNTFSTLLGKNPGIREALEKLTEDGCFSTLSYEEKELLNRFGFKAIKVDDNVGTFDHLDYNSRTFLGYLYELDVQQYMRVHSACTMFYRALNDLLPKYKAMVEWGGDQWPYITILREGDIESPLAHHQVYDGIEKVTHQKLKKLKVLLGTLSDVELKVLWLMTYRQPSTFRIVGMRNDVMLVKAYNLRLGLFI